MHFESHWFDTSQFVTHNLKHMSHNAYCCYSVRRKGNSTVQAALPAGQPEIIKNKGINSSGTKLLQYILPHSSFIISEATWQKYPMWSS